MANSKRSRKKAVPLHRLFQFPQVKGKTVADVRLLVSSDEYSITFDFEDKTSLSFDIEPGVSVVPELAAEKGGNWNQLRVWRPVPSVSSRL